LQSQKTKNIYYVFALSQILIFFLFSLTLLVEKIPFFASDVDPEYAYLVNGINILGGITPGHADHPGATLQIVLAIFFIFFNTIIKPFTLSNYKIHLVENPESYAVGYSVLLLLVVSLISYLIIKKFVDSEKALLFSFYPPALLLALSGEVGMLVRLNPESLLIVISITLVLVILSIKEISEYRIIKYKKIFILSFLLAAGIATKITFIPMMIIVIFVRGLKQKIFLITSSFLIFILLILPLRLMLSVTWFFNIFINSGRWGEDRARSFVQIINSVKDLWVIQYPLIFIVLIMYTVALFVSNLRLKKQTFILTLILLMLIISGSSLVIKETQPRDFVHLAPFVAIFFLIILSELIESLESKLSVRLKKILFNTVLISFSSFFLYLLPRLDTDILILRHVIFNTDKARNVSLFPGFEFNDKSLDLMSQKNYFVSQYRTPTEFAGLQFGNLYFGRNSLGKEIAVQFPYGLELNIWNSTIYNGAGEIVGCNFFEDAIKNGSSIYLHSSDIAQTKELLNNSPHSYGWEFYQEFIEIKSSRIFKVRSVGCE